jgi:RNA-directed DNA polymerase
MSTQLSKLAAKAKSNSKLCFTSLAHLLTAEFLHETWRWMNHKGASGIDGETIKQFEGELAKRVQVLVEKLKAGCYRAPPVRRVDIPKSNGKKRSLGIPTVEDRLLQKAVARILEAIFEQDFQDVSYGYRSGRNPHQALRALRGHIIADKVKYIYEADIQGYFTNINHSWLRKMLAQRIADPVILRLINKWLKAGVMDNGVVRRQETGTPQGGPVSCILANIYLHYVLDLWFEKKFKRTCYGEVHLVRFVDDFVICCQLKHEAERLVKAVSARLQYFSLDLAPEKTRLIEFGRFAKEKTGRAETFEFLGFKHVCGTDRLGKFALIRIPSQKSCHQFLDRTKAWLRKHRHWKGKDQQRYLSTMLKGFYQYFALQHAKAKLDAVRKEVQRQWITSLRRRSQRHRLFWSYLLKLPWFDLPFAQIIHRMI